MDGNILLNIPLPEDLNPPLLDLEPPPPPPLPPAAAGPAFLFVEKAKRPSSANNATESGAVKRLKVAKIPPPPPPPPLLPPESKVAYARQVFTAPAVVKKKSEDAAAAALKDFEKAKKRFEAKIAEIFSSNKPHSATKVQAVASLAVALPTLYKVVDRSLALLADKMLAEKNFAGFRTCVFLVDAIISAAKTKFQEKEKFSGRFYPMIVGRLMQFINLQPKPSAILEESKRLASDLRKTKRECLRIVNKWLTKKRFENPGDLKRHFAEWSSSFPELVALKTSSANAHTRKSELKTPSPLKNLLRSAKADPFAPGTLAASRNDFVSRVNQSINNTINQSSSLNRQALLPGPSTGEYSSLRSGAPSLAPPQLPVYNASLGTAKGAPSLLETPSVGRFKRLPLGPPPTSSSPHLEPVPVASVPTDVGPKTVARKVDPLDYLDRWKGFTPKPRPNHFTVVTCLLSLSNLPKDEASETLEATIQRLFGHYGTVVRVTIRKKLRTAIIQMENRSQALRAKRAIVDPIHHQQTTKEPVVHDEKEIALLTSVRSNLFNKIKLEWFPTKLLHTTYLKCWESVPHGVSYIPYRVCHTDNLAHFQCVSEFDLEKFALLAQEIVGGQEAVILPDSLGVPGLMGVVRERYQKITEPLFGSAARKGKSAE